MRFLSLLPIAVVAAATATIRPSDKAGKSADQHIITSRQQEEAFNATELPRAALPWGKVNFVHTTDSHGRLDGHANVPSWGGDWGTLARVDLLLVDSGDFHDGGGLSDSTDPKGSVSDSIFQNVDYDLVTVGNHGVRSMEEALNVHFNMSRVFGGRFLTSNVDVRVNGALEPMGYRYRAFQTVNGLRIVAFGVTISVSLRDMDNTEIYSAEWVFNQPWFAQAMKEEADIYVLVGHAFTYSPCVDPKKDNPLVCLRDRIRKATDKPIQVFGGHAHHRNFTCYDETSGIKSGKYGDTVGWVALNEVPSTCSSGESNYPLDRRYLDWNRVSFAYHTVGLEEDNISVPAAFDMPLGRKVSDDITKGEHLLNLTYYLGCAKEDYCFNCKKIGEDGNIYEVLKDAMADVVVQQERKHVSRVVIANDGTIRDNIYQGPFTLGDAYAVVPFPNTFLYLVNMRCRDFKAMKSKLQVKSPVSFSGDNEYTSFDDPLASHLELRSIPGMYDEQDNHSPGCTTHDGLGNDGDDTLHSPIIEDERYMKLFWGNASFPDPSRFPDSSDVVFTSYLQKRLLGALNAAGLPYTENDVLPYLPSTYTSRDVFLPEYIARH
ncbi:Metallo-dependent phosphatase-like protein [Aspergillus aurantiobrunneus]